MSVVLFHAFPNGLRGGFVGVDIFFVISGFLISSIIFSGLHRGDFNFTEFYARRIRRIFPALILVLAASFTLGWFALVPEEFKQLGKHIAASAGFVQNLVLWKEAGYFDTASELKPLMHLWSLAIEEQFYLAYPLILWVAWRLGLNVLRTVILLGLVSFSLNVFGIKTDAIETFFVPQTRFWELLAGSALSYLQLFKRAQFDDWLQHWVFHPAIFRQIPLSAHRETVLNNLLSVLGLLLILAAALGTDEAKSFPGWLALVPVSGAFLLIMAGPETWVNREILAHRWMVLVGVISYPLYLWHWPILSFARIVEPQVLSGEIRTVAVGLSFLLAWLTYRLIERPIRIGRQTWVKTATLSVLLTLVGYVGYNSYERNGLAFRIPQEIREIANVGTYESFPFTPYKVKRICNGDRYQTSCLEEQEPAIFLWGDSHAASLYAGFNALQKTYSIGIGQSTGCGNPPFLSLGNYTDGASCDTPAKRLAANEAALSAIARTHPDIIILHARWAYDRYHISQPETIKRLQETISRVRAVSLQSKIVVLGPMPTWKSTLAREMYRHWKDTFPHSLPPIYMQSGLVAAVAQWDNFLAVEVPKLGVTYVSAYKILCNGDGCLTRVGPKSSDLTAVDYGHLSPAGSIYVADHLAPSLFMLLNKNRRPQPVKDQPARDVP